MFCSFFLTGNATKTLDIQNTTEGVVKTHEIQNTPEGDVRMCYTGLPFPFRAVQEKHKAFKTHQRVM